MIYVIYRLQIEVNGFSSQSTFEPKFGVYLLGCLSLHMFVEIKPLQDLFYLFYIFEEKQVFGVSFGDV